MSRTEVTASDIIQERSIENAYELAALLRDRTEKRTDGLTVYLGDHPTMGRLWVIIPPLGNAIVFPSMSHLLSSRE